MNARLTRPAVTRIRKAFHKNANYTAAIIITTIKGKLENKISIKRYFF